MTPTPTLETSTIITKEYNQTTFFDGDFSSEWLDIVILTDDSSVEGIGSETSSGSVSLKEVGGNPAFFRESIHDMVFGDIIYTGGLNVDAVYDPTVSGAIESIEVTIDLGSSQSSFNGDGGTGWGLYLKQDENLYYLWPLQSFGNSTWQTHKLTNLTMTDFSDNNNEHPDFSLNGDPIFFGYVLGNGMKRPGETMLVNRVDNWQVVVKPAMGLLKIIPIENTISGNPTVLTPYTELILDASNSMWGQIDGKAKMDIAKDVMYRVIDELPDTTEVALRLYGHSISVQDSNACQDTELVFPFRKIDKERLKGILQEIKPRGTTPIAYSLEQVAEDFKDIVGEKRIVLVTDGIEACGVSYTAAINELEAKGLEVKLLIVAFAIKDEETKQELEAAAERTGGEIYDAQSADELFDAISKAVAVPVSYKVLDNSKTTVATGFIGRDAIELLEGMYTIIVQTEEKEISIPNVPISMNSSTIVNLLREGQEIGYEIQAP